MKLHEIFPDVLELFETMGSRFSKLKWEQSGGIFTGNAELNNIQFKLKIEVQNLKVQETEKTWLNLAFSRVINGENVETLVNTGQNQSATFGAVLNALRDKVNELDEKYKIDGIVFIAASSELKRLSLYRKLANSKIHGFPGWFLTAEVESKNGKALICVKEKMSSDFSNKLKSYLAQYGKILL